MKKTVPLVFSVLFRNKHYRIIKRDTMIAEHISYKKLFSKMFLKIMVKNSIFYWYIIWCDCTTKITYYSFFDRFDISLLLLFYERFVKQNKKRRITCELPPKFFKILIFDMESNGYIFISYESNLFSEEILFALVSNIVFNSKLSFASFIYQEKLT